MRSQCSKNFWRLQYTSCFYLDFNSNWSDVVSIYSDYFVLVFGHAGTVNNGYSCDSQNQLSSQLTWKTVISLLHSALKFLYILTSFDIRFVHRRETTDLGHYAHNLCADTNLIMSCQGHIHKRFRFDDTNITLFANMMYSLTIFFY